MRCFSKVFAAAVVLVAFAVPATAAGFGGGGPPEAGGGGSVLPSPGGGSVGGPHGLSGPSRLSGGVKPPPSPGGPSFESRLPHYGASPLRGAAPNRANRRHDADLRRRRPRHYWLGGGPVFIPDPSGDYLYGDDDYDDGSDPTGCWVYRKAYDRSHAFLGWVRVDECESQ